MKSDGVGVQERACPMEGAGPTQTSRQSVIISCGFRRLLSFSCNAAAGTVDSAGRARCEKVLNPTSGSQPLDLQVRQKFKKKINNFFKKTLCWKSPPLKNQHLSTFWLNFTAGCYFRFWKCSTPNRVTWFPVFNSAVATPSSLLEDYVPENKISDCCGIWDVCYRDVFH